MTDVRPGTTPKAVEPARLFATISPLLDTPTLRDLSAQVLVEGREPDRVAQDWLRGHGLI